MVNHARWVIVVAVAVRRRGRGARAQRRRQAVGGRLREPAVGVGARPPRTCSPRFPAAGEPDFVVLVTARETDRSTIPTVTEAATALTENGSRRARGDRSALVLDALEGATAQEHRRARRRSIIGTLRGELGERVETAKRLSPEFTQRTGDPHRGHRALRGRPSGERALGEGRPTLGDHHRRRSRRSRSLLVFGSIVAAGLPLVDRRDRGRRHAARVAAHLVGDRGVDLRA